MGRSRYFLHLIHPIFQQVEGDVSSQQYPLQSGEEEREDSSKEGSSNKGMCVLENKTNQSSALSQTKFCRAILVTL